MLNLAGIPIRAQDRTDLFHIVVAGGPCACNPEPLADFVDLFFIGEGEQVDLEVIRLYQACKRGKKAKKNFTKAAQIQGVYVPSLYSVTYHDDGTIKK